MRRLRRPWDFQDYEIKMHIFCLSTSRNYIYIIIWTLRLDSDIFWSVLHFLSCHGHAGTACSLARGDNNCHWRDLVKHYSHSCHGRKVHRLSHDSHWLQDICPMTHDISANLSQLLTSDYKRMIRYPLTIPSLTTRHKQRKGNLRYINSDNSLQIVKVYNPENSS